MKGPAAYPELIQTCRTVPFEGHAFRVISGSHVVGKIAFDRLLFGSGAGRCNPPGVVRLYVALEEATAVAEFEHYQWAGGVDPALAESFHYPVQVKLRAVVDLCDAGQRKHLGLTLSDLRRDYRDRRPFTRLQTLGAVVARSTTPISGFLLPSVRRSGGRNLVVFRAKLASGSGEIVSVADPTKKVP